LPPGGTRSKHVFERCASLRLGDGHHLASLIGFRLSETEVKNDQTNESG